MTLQDALTVHWSLSLTLDALERTSRCLRGYWGLLGRFPWFGMPLASDHEDEATQDERKPNDCGSGQNLAQEQGS